MKPVILAVILALAVIAPQPVAAASESVRSFNVTGTLTASGALLVTETIEYDFAGNPPHTFTRTIPITYQDDQGAPHPMTFRLLGAKSGDTQLHVSPTLDPKLARITLPASTAQPQTYEIRYSLSPIVIHGYNADVFKVNVTGPLWPAPIQSASFKFSSPGLKGDNFTCSITSGATALGKCSVAESEGTVTASTTAPLDISESMTFSASFPKGSFKSYLEAKQSWLEWLPLALAGLLLAALAVGLPLYLALRARHRDARRVAVDKPPKEAESDN